MAGDLSRRLKAIQDDLKAASKDIRQIVNVEERIKALTSYQENLQSEFDSLVAQVKRLDDGFTEIVKQRDKAIEQSMNLIALNQKSGSRTDLIEQLEGVNKAYDNINRDKKGV